MSSLFRHKRFTDIMHSNYLIDEYDDQFDNESDSHFDDCDEALYRTISYKFLFHETKGA